MAARQHAEMVIARFTGDQDIFVQWQAEGFTRLAALPELAAYYQHDPPTT